MKGIVFLVSAFFISLLSQAQSQYNLIFFSENGEKFTVTLNGASQNQTPAANVQVIDLNASTYKVRIDFEKEELGFFDKDLFMPEESAELTYNIRRNNKGIWVLRQYAYAAYPEQPKQADQYETVTYRESDDEPFENEISSTSVTTSTITTVKTTRGQSQNENVNINMNMGETSMSIEMEMSDPETTEHITTYTTTTTTQSARSTEEEVRMEEVLEEPHGCGTPMADHQFESALESIASKDFEDSKLQIAKQIAERNCLTSNQVKLVMFEFTYEESKLEFAKFAHSRVHDPENYYEVNDAFDYESSIEELSNYLERF